MPSPRPPVRSSDWLKASPLQAHRLALSSLRPPSEPHAASSRESCRSLAGSAPSCERRGSQGPVARGTRGFSGTGVPTRDSVVEPSPANGRMKKKSGEMDCYLRRLKQELVREERVPGRAAPRDLYLAPPDPGSRDARGRKLARERGRGRAPAGRQQGLSRA